MGVINRPTNNNIMKYNYYLISDFFTLVPYIYQTDVAREMGISAVQLNNYVKCHYAVDKDFVQQFNIAVKCVANNGRIKPMYIAKEMGAYRTEVSAWMKGRRSMPAHQKKSYDETVKNIRDLVSASRIKK